MSKILTLPVIIIFSFLTFENSTELKTLNETEYEKDLNIACELFLKKNEIPELVLIKLVPDNPIKYHSELNKCEQKRARTTAHSR